MFVFHLHISFPKLLNNFHFNLVFEFYTKSYQGNFILIHINPLLYINLKLNFIEIADKQSWYMINIIKFYNFL